MDCGFDSEKEEENAELLQKRHLSPGKAESIREGKKPNNLP